MEKPASEATSLLHECTKPAMRFHITSLKRRLPFSSVSSKAWRCPPVWKRSQQTPQATGRSVRRTRTRICHPRWILRCQHSRAGVRASLRAMMRLTGCRLRPVCLFYRIGTRLGGWPDDREKGKGFVSNLSLGIELESTWIRSTEPVGVSKERLFFITTHRGRSNHRVPWLTFFTRSLCFISKL